MAFTIKKGDLAYAADDTLGFVSEVYRPEGGDPAAGRHLLQQVLPRP